MGTSENSGYSYEDFENIELIGSGGNADVFKSKIEVGGDSRIVALKTPRMSEYETVDTGFFDDFIKEAELWNRIDDHNNIVSVYDWGSDPYPWIALDYMGAGNLSTVSDSFTLSQRAELFEQICNGVFYAHRHGITHSDLKPANILLSRDSSGELVAKIGDWGLANLLLEHSQTMNQMTLAYSAPEQVDSTKYGSVDDRTDIYQLGVIAYELFAGSSPFDSDQAANKINEILNETPQNPSERNTEVPPAVGDAILQSLAKEKGERYETVTHLRDGVITAVNEAESRGNSNRHSEQQSSPRETSDDEYRNIAGSKSSGDTSSSNVSTVDKDQAAERQSVSDSLEVTTSAETSSSTSNSTDTGGSATGSSSSSRRRRKGQKNREKSEKSPEQSSEGLFDRVWGIFQKPVTDIDYGQRSAIGDISFAFGYARTTDSSTLKRGMGTFLLTLIYGLGLPILLGYALDVIQTTAREKKEVPAFQWVKNAKHGLILLGALTASFISVVMSVEISENIAAIGLLLWMFLLPAFIINYGVTRGLRSAFGWKTVRMTLSLRYIGMIIGAYVVLLIGYIVTAFSFLTIIGGFAAGFLSVTALAAYTGRRYSGHNFA